VIAITRRHWCRWARPFRVQGARPHGQCFRHPADERDL